MFEYQSPENFPSTSNTNTDSKIRIVAVGASAGGLGALKSFFGSLPGDDKNSYVVVQHLSPVHESRMDELLGKITKLPIEQIDSRTELKPGCIYLIPPASNLLMKEGRSFLQDKPLDQRLNLPVDMFLESLATCKGADAAAVILSGTGSDGTKGIRAIKENGGIVLVQDPEQAEFSGMPQSAIQTGLADFILPAERMGAELHRLTETDPGLLGEYSGAHDEQELLPILKTLKEATGTDFSEYKTATLFRRIQRRLIVCKCTGLSEYHEYLQEQPEEVIRLHREFLIGVTWFFRDQRVWEILRKKVIPEIVEKTKEGEILKVWDVGCSTGEEAFSLAICLQEELERQQKKTEVKIFATDISREHLETGKQGRYPAGIAADVPQKLLEKYFSEVPGGYKVSENIRQMVIFSRHDLVRNPPFSNMGMVICRNLLIYLQAGIQRKAMNMLHYGLREGGFLVLGSSEDLNAHSEYFEKLSRKWKIFKNMDPSKRIKSETLRTSEIKIPDGKPQQNVRERFKVKNQRRKYISELSEAVLEQFGGASLLVDKDYNILEALGQFRKYANLPVSGFSVNLLEMLGQDLKQVVLVTAGKAAKEDRVSYYSDAVYEHEGETKMLDLIVKPFVHNNLEGEKGFVISFTEKDYSPERFEKVERLKVDADSGKYISNLEEELKRTREELENSLEEIEASNEELQSANEELLASNEELQSTNEELQSVNEEINTINAENIQKMDDLASLNADMNNLLESTEIGTIFLDSSLRIRKFTPAVKEHFSLLNSDIGRPIDHFTVNFGIKKGRRLTERCKKVIRTGEMLEKKIISREGRCYLQRIYPFVNSGEETEGVVITFVDIENLERAKNSLIASEKRFKSLYEEDPVLHLSVDPASGRIVYCNRKSLEKLGYTSKEQLIGRSIYELYSEETQVQAIKTGKKLQEKGELSNIEQEMLTAEGKRLPVILNAFAEKDEDDNVITHRYTCVDISDLKEAQEELKAQKADLERANRDLEQFVSICSHDLQEPLATIKFGSDILGKLYKDRLDQKGRDYISYIDEACDRLSAQIKALLEHSRIGKNSEKTLVDTQELVEVVKYDLGKRIRDTNALIHAGTLPKVEAYKVELRLLFQNLLSNALKYISKDRRPEIRISAFPEDEYWVFAVMDNGIGMSPEDQENIFTIFNRVPTEEKYEGNGVGLAHAEKIVVLHEGAIWVDSQPDVGSTFYFRIKR